MRIAITLVIEMTDEQVEQYADAYGLPRRENGKVYARDVVEDVRSMVHNTIQESPVLGEVGADVTIKRQGR